VWGLSGLLNAEGGRVPGKRWISGVVAIIAVWIKRRGANYRAQFRTA
jgi:hypothetical protein